MNGSASPLFAHQAKGVTFASQKSCALFWEPGCGKTRTTLEAFIRLRDKNPALRLLVVCPLSLIHAAWGEDTRRFTELSFAAYREMKALPDVLAVNYETLISKKHLPEILKILRSGLWACVADESSRMKQYKSLTTKTLLSLTPYFMHRIVLSGTPMPNSEQELWGQIQFISPDTLPSSFFAFRNTYFHLARGNQIMNHPTGKLDRRVMQDLFQKGWKYGITPAKRKALMERIAPVCSWLKKKDALDLPEQIDQVRSVQLSPDERRAYREMEKHLVIELSDDVITAPVALAKLMKLRQVTSGFAYNAQGDALPIGNSKLNELLAVLEDLGEQQVIIWIQFKAEMDALKEALSNKSVVTLYSETDDREASIKDFQEGRAQYLIAHPRSAAHGLTFAQCSTQIFYSLDYSYEAYEQARNRTHRIGQKNTCVYIHLLAQDSIDEDILSVLRRKNSLQELVAHYARKRPKTESVELLEAALS